ncbi:MAG: prepilin peptidase, partial [Deltaproteobacteria bacterium]|nr:prepilin peptidase [Deltaproteobacteria bacterium]
MTPTAIYALFALVFGLLVGSFLNVCICRLPRNESIVSPPSHCPLCVYQIRWYDNIPLLSYLLLRGKCRGCGAHISLQYPLVELLNGILALLLFLRFGLTAAFAAFFLFCSA